MANIDSNLVTAQAAAQRDPSAGLVNMDDAAGLLLAATCKVTIPATPTADDTFTLLSAELCPVGAVLVPSLSSVYMTDAAGVEVTLALDIDVGTTTDPDKFADALDIKAVGLHKFDASGTAPVAIAAPYRHTTPEAIIATVKTSTDVVGCVAVFLLVFRAKA